MAINYDDYKKKYKKQIEENRDKWRKQNEVSVSNTKKTTQTTTTTTQKNDDKKWYQKIFQKPESFEDGYDFGDVTKTILGTTADVGLNLVEGVARVGEGIGKLGAGGIAQVADWIGQDDYAEKVRNRIAGKEKTAFGTTGAPVSSWLNSAQNKLDSHSITGESGDEIASLVGYTGGLMVGGNALGGLTKTGTVGSVATSSAGVTTGTGLSANLGNIGVTVAGKTLNVPTLAFVGGASSGLTEAYGKENVTDTQAWSKALGSGAREGITEGLFGMFGVGGSSLDDALTKVVTNKLKTGLTKILAKTGVQATGESVEEFLSYAGNQGLDWLIDKASSEESPDFYNKWDWEEVGEQMGMAFISGGITQGGGTIVQTELQTRIAIETAEQELGRKLTESEKTSIKKQVTDAIINETELNQEELIQVQETNDPIAPVQEEVQQEATEDIAPVVEEQQETVTNEVVPPTVQQEITNITNQIDELETMLDTNLTATQQQEILAQIKELEQRYNEITQQEQAVFKTANTQEIGPVEAVNTEQISKPTTQEVETNSLVEAESNTPNVVKSASNDQNIQNEQEIAPLEQKTGTFEQQVMTEEEYLASKGYGAMGYSEPGLHKSSARVSQKVRDKQAKQVQEKAQEYDAKREELRQEYQAKVESGEIRKPTREETLLRTAQGNEDNKSVQSARRLLEKRGIDWKTGEKIGETTKNAQQQEKKATKTTENAQKNENIVQNADRKTPTQEELDNLEYIRKNKSGSEYASAYYDLEKKYGTGLYKGLNSYKDTGKAVQEEIAPVKETIEDLTVPLNASSNNQEVKNEQVKEEDIWNF